jgi:hypothetical protein
MCFNKSKGVLITGPKLKAFRNPQPSWGFSVHNKTGEIHILPGFFMPAIQQTKEIKSKNWQDAETKNPRFSARV